MLVHVVCTNIIYCFNNVVVLTTGSRSFKEKCKSDATWSKSIVRFKIIVRFKTIVQFKTAKIGLTWDSLLPKNCFIWFDEIALKIMKNALISSERIFSCQKLKIL